MVNQRELQERILAYRILQSKLDDNVKERDLITNKLIEVENTLVSIDEIKKTEEKTAFPMGSDVYVFAKSSNKEKLMIGIGANILMEKTFEEGKETLNKSKKELEKILDDIQKEINQISCSIEEMTPELQEMIEKSQRAD